MQKMKKRALKRALFLFFLLIGMGFAGYPTQGTIPKQGNLNILLISIYTIRPDRLSCYGSEHLKTPNIDALASNGVVFERAFAHNPTTLPSHTNILLGTTPLHHGVHDNAKFKVADDFLTLAEYLKQKGYATGAFIGAFPLDSRFGLAQGFDVYDESYPSGTTTAFAAPERRAEEVIKAATDWLASQRSQWFAFIHLWDPHTIYSPPEPFLTEFKDDLYSGEVAYVDAELGKLFGYLERRDLLKNTLIVLTGDHGESLGEHGELTHSYFAYNSTLWVPLIIAAPGIDARRLTDHVCHVDIFPTVCDILKTDKPPFLQGISLLPLMQGKKLEKKAIYFESLAPYYNARTAPLRGFVEGGKKFFDSPIPEYYDLETDFDEENNLVQKINLEEQQKRLMELIQAFSSSQMNRDPDKVDRGTLEKLRSLGYVSSSYPNIKQSYGPEDDLKSLLPFQQKLEEAIVLSDRGRFEESVALLTELIQEKKEMERVYLYLHHIYRMQGRPEKSLELMEKGHRNNPESFDIISAYGILLIEKGEWDLGVAMFQKALTFVDFDPMVWNYLGFAFWRKGEEQKALDHYRQALALDGSFAMTHANLGRLYFSKFARTKKKSDYLHAMEYFKKAIECDPELAMAYKWLGIGYKLGGRIDAAITIWEKALELDPSDDSVVLDLGKAHLERGSKSSALPYFEQYLRLRKDSLLPEERQEIEALIQKCRQK
jgi:arylsulfatase A-like enzyme/Tfp pilus assembly protein PilF